MSEFSDYNKFPESLQADAVLEINDVSSDTYENMVKYQTYVSKNNFSEASALLESDTDLKKCIINANKLNIIQDRIKILQEYSLSLKSQNIISTDSPSEDALILNGGIWEQNISMSDSDIFVDDYIKYNNAWYRKKYDFIYANTVDATTVESPNVFTANLLVGTNKFTQDEMDITATINISGDTTINNIVSKSDSTTINGILATDTILLNGTNVYDKISSMQERISDAEGVINYVIDSVGKIKVFDCLKLGTGLYSTSENVLNTNIASSTQLGLVKIGNNITCDIDGVISITKDNIKSIFNGNTPYSTPEELHDVIGDPLYSITKEMVDSACDNKIPYTKSAILELLGTDVDPLYSINSDMIISALNYTPVNPAKNTTYTSGVTLTGCRLYLNNSSSVGCGSIVPSDDGGIYITTNDSSKGNINIRSTKGDIILRARGDMKIVNLDSNGEVTTGVYFNATSSTASNFSPMYNGKTSLGTKDKLWTQLYAKNSTINISDRNKKNNIHVLNNKYVDLFNKLQPVSFKFNDGDRTHTGFIAQDVESAMISVGLNSTDFAALCKDVVEADGEKQTTYGLRYSEFVSLNTYMIQKLQERVVELEKKLAEVAK